MEILGVLVILIFFVVWVRYTYQNMGEMRSYWSTAFRKLGHDHWQGEDIEPKDYTFSKQAEESLKSKKRKDSSPVPVKKKTKKRTTTKRKTTKRKVK